MAIDPVELQRHLDNYADVTGHKTDRFVCPITLRECDPSELIDGHILNAAFTRASRKTVIQYGAVDSFYGSTVEPSLIEYMNKVRRTERDLLDSSREIVVQFADGSSAKAFLATHPNAKDLKKKFPRYRLPFDSGDIEVYVLMDAETLTSKVATGLSFHAYQYAPSHHAAAMLKAAYLAKFFHMGYRVVFNPFGDTLRRSLAEFYRQNGTREDASRFFADFRAAVKFGLMGQNLDQAIRTPSPFDFDTLEGGRMLFLHTPSDTLFAVNVIFQINGTTTGVFVPSTMTNGNVEVAWNFYRRLMSEERGLQFNAFLTEYRNGEIRQETRPLDIEFLDDDVVEKALTNRS